MPRNGITCSCRPVHARTSEDDPGLPAHGKEDHNGTALFLREELAHIGEYNRQGSSYPACKQGIWYHYETRGIDIDFSLLKI